MLVRVGSNLSQSPMRHLGGASISGLRSVWVRGERFNQSIGQGITSKLAGVPSGHLAPSSWILPYKAGAISSRNDSPAKLTTNSLNVAMGVNLTAPAVQCVITTSGNASSVASLIGSASASLMVAGSLSAPFNMTGSSLLSSSSSGTLTAIASLSGSASATVTSSLIAGAIAHLVAVPISQELTADQIASAVWSALANVNNSAGTMGELLNNASSGSGGGSSNALTLPQFLALK